jgi:hypothetical protein
MYDYDMECTIKQREDTIKLLDKKIKDLENIVREKILIVEDGSVDTAQLMKDFTVIVYKQGSTPPRFINNKE